jgi:AraC-like DNA-binding protein
MLSAGWAWATDREIDMNSDVFIQKRAGNFRPPLHSNQCIGAQAIIELMVAALDTVIVADIFGKTGVPMSSFVHQSTLPLSASQFALVFYPLMRALYAKSPGTSAMGLADADDIELLCRCLIHCNNLQEVITTAVRFANTSGARWPQLHMQDDNQNIAFCKASRRTKNNEINFSLDVLELCFFYKLWSWLIAEPLQLIRAEFAFAWHEEPLVASLFNCPIAPNSSRAALVFKKEFMEKPVIRTYEELLKILKFSPIPLVPLPRLVSVSARIEMLFCRAFSTRTAIPTLEQVAYRLTKSVSTLRRNLTQENTSFQQIKDQWRRQRAQELLNTTEMVIDDIANVLGFSGASAFSRAFKEWTGLAPSCFRRR